MDENDWILFDPPVVFGYSHRRPSSVDCCLPPTAEREAGHSRIVSTESLLQEYLPNRQMPVWLYNLFLIACFVWCSSITNYISLAILAYLSQHRFITSKERVVLFSLQSCSFLLQYPRFHCSEP